MKACKKKVENIKEQSLHVDGQFMSETDMTKAGIPERLGCVKAVNCIYKIEIVIYRYI